MNILDFLKDSEWDVPFFKKLPRNDTGEAAGHQGGLVIPKDLRKFFPTLLGTTDDIQPTIAYTIKADLHNGIQKVTSVYTRYQIQTWGGTRKPESRLTSNLGPIRNIAHTDDILLFQRNMENLDHYRLILIKKGLDIFNEISSVLPSTRWGTLSAERPISQSDIERIEQQQKENESQPFELFEEESRLVETRSVRIARSIVFRHTIRKIYKNNCVVCETGLMTPQNIFEIEASHIVPKSQNGIDDARNGLSFCKRHHWAYDKGLFGIDNDYKVIVPRTVLRLPQNKILSEFVGKEILPPNVSYLRPETAALTWHRENILIA